VLTQVLPEKTNTSPSDGVIISVSVKLTNVVSFSLLIHVSPEYTNDSPSDGKLINVSVNSYNVQLWLFDFLY